MHLLTTKTNSSQILNPSGIHFNVHIKQLKFPKTFNALNKMIKIAHTHIIDLMKIHFLKLTFIYKRSKIINRIITYHCFYFDKYRVLTMFYYVKSATFRWKTKYILNWTLVSCKYTLKCSTLVYSSYLYCMQWETFEM